MDSIQQPPKPINLCECGCGSDVGPQRRFVSGHNFRLKIPVSQRIAKGPAHRRKYLEQWHTENRDRRLSDGKERKRQLKIKTLTHYGHGECKCLMCGYDNLVALTLDHINDDGYLDGRSGHELYGYLLKNSFPDGYQTLCMNCQYIKRDANGNHTRR